MGSDWYMTELAGNYAGEYYTTMFELLAELTHQMGGEWDAWHQFSVINPLLFLGLLNSEDGITIPEQTEKATELKYYDLNIERLKNAYRNARGKIENKKWQELVHFSPIKKTNVLDQLYDRNLDNLTKSRIYTAESIKSVDKLAILNIW